MRTYPIGRLLLKHQYITNAAFEQLKEEGEKRDTEEYDLLRELNIISVSRLMQAFSHIFSLEIVDLDLAEIDEGLLELFPQKSMRKLGIIPLQETEKELVLAVSNPTLIAEMERLRYYTEKKFVLRVADREQIIKRLNLYSAESESAEAIERLEDAMEQQKRPEETILANILDDTSDAPTIRLTNSIISKAITEGASDIHIEPYERNVAVRYRIDGRLIVQQRLPMNVFPALITRFKLMGGMDIAERRVPQEGRLEIMMDNVGTDLRFSTIPNIFGEKLVIRLLRKNALNKGVEELGFDEESLGKVKSMLDRTNGIILVTGPTGSGKSTTLYSFLKHLKSDETAIVTVEDPVEYTIEGFNQTQVSVKQGMTFPVALKAILRQDPDIIMIGEIRDEETAHIAVRASITGHLVLSTLHTNSAVSSMGRLLNMGVESYLLADSLRGVVAQRLIRRLCPYCKEKYLASEDEKKTLGVDYPVFLYKAKGCARCNDTGYQGRFAIFEVLHVTPEIGHMLQSGEEVSRIAVKLEERGDYQTLAQSVKKAILKGETSMQEIKEVDIDD